MSHIATVKTRISDRAAVAAACQRLGMAAPTEGTAQLYSGEATGCVVRLEGWKYPIVIDTAAGTIKYDNFEGHWGAQEKLDQFLRCYAVEKVKLEARKKGFSLSEQALQDGSVKIQIVEA
jgi:hypothetical protein